jgi:hypothetical protein
MWEFEREKKLSYIIGMLATQLDAGAGDMHPGLLTA